MISIDIGYVNVKKKVMTKHNIMHVIIIMGWNVSVGPLIVMVENFDVLPCMLLLNGCFGNENILGWEVWEEHPREIRLWPL